MSKQSAVAIAEGLPSVAHPHQRRGKQPSTQPAAQSKPQQHGRGAVESTSTADVANRRSHALKQKAQRVRGQSEPAARAPSKQACARFSAQPGASAATSDAERAQRRKSKSADPPAIMLPVLNANAPQRGSAGQQMHQQGGRASAPGQVGLEQQMLALMLLNVPLLSMPDAPTPAGAGDS